MLLMNVNLNSLILHCNTRIHCRDFSGNVFFTLLGNIIPNRWVLYFPMLPKMETQMENTLTPRIYVACLAAYNAGSLHGDWIDATQDEEDIYEDIRTILADSPDNNGEGWVILDHDGFDDFDLDEYESITSVCKKAKLIIDYGEVGMLLFEYYGDSNKYYNDLDEINGIITNHYHGEWDSELKFATELFDECYLHEMPEHLNFHIDYGQFARDIFINDYFSLNSRSNKKHIFSNY